jgi:hypothetical protein
MSDAGRFPAATCWFCDRAPGTAASIALPFLSLPDHQDVRVVVLPRCDACRAVHTRKQTHPYVIVVGCVFPLMLAAMFLPVSDDVLPWVGAAAMLTGLVVGLVIVAVREQRVAKRHGIKPESAMVGHPLYQQWGRDTGNWRLQTGPRNPMKHRTHARWTSVSDHRVAFANDPQALAALEEGCRVANVPAS